MTQLLVSVRNLAEARSAVRGGADLIDLKDPERGALGACPLSVWRDVVNSLGQGYPISAACGELRNAGPVLLAEHVAGLDFIKLGLSRCRAWPRWRQAWSRRLDELPCSVRAVAVAYADAATCRAPVPAAVIQMGAELGCSVFLVDTYFKNGVDVFGHLSVAQLQRLFAEARLNNMLTVLAGSLSLDCFDRALATRPDVIAVRGAACEGGRRGTVHAARVASLRAALPAPV